MARIKRKKCPGCKSRKSVVKFSKDRRAKDKLQYYCKECQKKNKQTYKQTHAKEIRKYNRSAPCRYSKYKDGAKRKGLEFNLTLEQFEKITFQICCYCGKYAENKKYCGVDRVDNDIGYKLNNCVPCCEVCNMMKRELTKKKFLDHVRDIYTHSFKDFYDV